MWSKICIVGASLSGLMCANSLISQGLDVTILEQKTKDDMRSTTGISLGRPVRYLFRKYVPYGNLEKKAVPHNKSVNFSREGEIQDNPLLKSSEEVITSSWSNVRSLLEANLPGQTYGHGANISLKYGCKVTGMEEEKGEMKLTYFDCGEQKADLFDLVIGADGARSSVRNMVLPDLKSEYSGHVAWRGEVLKQGCPSQLECVQQGALGFIRMPRSKSYILLYAKPSGDEATSDDNRIVEWCWYRPCTDPSVYFQRDGAVYANVEPNSDVWARHIDSSASDLPPWIAPAIRASKSLSVSQINSFDAQENVFHGGRVLLIGQACAEIEPYLGKSCDVAAYQIKTLAETLAEQLSGQETWEDCLRNLDSAWGPRTLRYTQQVAAESKSAGRLFRGKSD